MGKDIDQMTWPEVLEEMANWSRKNISDWKKSKNPEAKDVTAYFEKVLTMVEKWKKEFKELGPPPYDEESISEHGAPWVTASITKRLDRVATYLEPVRPDVTLALDRISDKLDWTGNERDLTPKERNLLADLVGDLKKTPHKDWIQKVKEYEKKSGVHFCIQPSSFSRDTSSGGRSHSGHDVYVEGTYPREHKSIWNEPDDEKRVKYRIASEEIPADRLARYMEAAAGHGGKGKVTSDGTTVKIEAATPYDLTFLSGPGFGGPSLEQQERDTHRELGIQRTRYTNSLKNIPSQKLVGFVEKLPYPINRSWFDEVKRKPDKWNYDGKAREIDVFVDNLVEYISDRIYAYINHDLMAIIDGMESQKMDVSFFDRWVSKLPKDTIESKEMLDQVSTKISELKKSKWQNLDSAVEAFHKMKKLNDILAELPPYTFKHK